MNGTEVQTHSLQILGEHTGMKSNIKIQVLSVEPHSSTNYID